MAKFFRKTQLAAQYESSRKLSRQCCCRKFFQLLKRERVKRKIYVTREKARAYIFDYIEIFYDATRKHSHTANMSPLAYEKLGNYK